MEFCGGGGDKTSGEGNELFTNFIYLNSHWLIITQYYFMNVDCEKRVNREGNKGYFRKISGNSTNTQDSDSQKPISTPDHPRSRGSNRKRYDPKYKTELCKNYSEKGYCPYRWKCQFAHGS